VGGGSGVGSATRRKEGGGRPACGGGRHRPVRGMAAWSGRDRGVKGLMCGPHGDSASQRGSTVSNDFKSIQNRSNLIQSKTDLPKLQKFQIKYGSNELEMRNNSSYRNLSRFE
jgi:hypothetical protein